MKEKPAIAALFTTNPTWTDPGANSETAVKSGK
jgi:hypothetical protein